MTKTPATVSVSYRRQAEKLRALAQSAADSSRKAELLALAREFETLAAFAERNPPSSEPS